MAVATSGVRTGIDTLLQTHFATKLRNTLFNRMLILYFLFARDGQKTGPDDLGRPKVNGKFKGVFVSGVETAKARQETILSSLQYQPIIQTTLPAVGDGKTMTMADNMPVRTNWESTLTSSYFTRPSVRWTKRADPYKVSNEEIRHTKEHAKNEVDGTTGIVSLFQAETVSVLGVHEKWWNSALWGTSFAGVSAPTNQDAQFWDAPFSMKNALSTSNTYCSVDRSQASNSYWRGADTSGYSGIADFETLINYTNYDLGLADKGMGIDLIICDKQNFKRAKTEAKSKGVVISTGGVPQFGEFGFLREIVKIDNTWIVYDPECPTGEVAAINLDTWTFAIHPEANFRISKPFDQSQIEGGDDAMAGYVVTKIMLVCEVPGMNAYYTSVTK